MELFQVGSIHDVAVWTQAQGLRVSEFEPFDDVDPVHTRGSLHYVGRAMDVNYYGGGRWGSENEALHYWYTKLLGAARLYGWPLEEIFFDGKGYIIELGYGNNHPIGGHDGHGHIGFRDKTWTSHTKGDGFDMASLDDLRKIVDGRVDGFKKHLDHRFDVINERLDSRSKALRAELIDTRRLLAVGKEDPSDPVAWEDYNLRDTIRRLNRLEEKVNQLSK